MKIDISRIFVLRLFDTSSDLENLESLNSPFRLFLIITFLVLCFCSFLSIIFFPAEITGLSFLALATSIKAIQVLIEWHLLLKALAKNNLIIVLMMTFILYYLMQN